MSHLHKQVSPSQKQQKADTFVILWTSFRQALKNILPRASLNSCIYLHLFGAHMPKMILDADGIVFRLSSEGLEHSHRFRKM